MTEVRRYGDPHKPLLTVGCRRWARTNYQCLKRKPASRASSTSRQTILRPS